jgi:hypothetical protein
MIPATVRFSEKLALLTEHWSPHVVAELNDYQFKLTKLRGEFVWHRHDETDEAFIVLAGRMVIEFRDGASSWARARCASCRAASSTVRSPSRSAPSCSWSRAAS